MIELVARGRFSKSFKSSSLTVYSTVDLSSIQRQNVALFRMANCNFVCQSEICLKMRCVSTGELFTYLDIMIVRRQGEISVS